MSDVAERVKKIVVEHLGVDEAKVTENASFIDDLGADSLDTVELVMAFEEEFGCEIPDDAAEKIVTVKDAVSFIEAHSGRCSAPDRAAHRRSRRISQHVPWARDGLSDEAGRRHRDGPCDAARSRPRSR